MPEGELPDVITTAAKVINRHAHTVSSIFVGAEPISPLARTLGMKKIMRM